MHINADCNKDEALRSLGIAEQKFLLHDVVGAKKFAVKAQCLYPDLEGLPQLSAVLDVHIVAQQKLDGVEVDWYGILQTDCRSDEATIRKQYRKLALILHPDKNKAAGAEGAFKLISEAWRVLSDKERKAAHDAKRMVKINSSPGFSVMKPMKGFRNFSHFNAWYQQPRQDDRKSSFWTGCPACKMQFEYLRVHENKNISCPTCGKFFSAVEIKATGRTPSSPWDHVFKEASTSCSDKRTDKSRSVHLGSSFSCSDKRTDKSRSVHLGSSFSSHWGHLRYPAANQKSAAEATAEMVHETYEAVRRERVKAQKEAREKAAMERMEAEIASRRREHRERKQKRKQEQEEKQSKATRVSSGSSGKGSGTEAMHVNDSELRRAGSVSFMPTETVESSSRREGGLNFMSTKDVENGMGHKSPPETTVNGTQDLGSRVRERVARHVQEPFWCRTLNTYDSTISYDSSELFSFSKRLKVDV